MATRLAQDARVLIIGAGPCGLGCARELHRLGHRNWLIVERQGHAGGLASSVVDPQGFTWDMAGHVVFSHFGEFDALVEEVMGAELLHHERSSYISFAGGWVPYPFQNNLHRLPRAVMRECLDGLRTAPGGHADMDFATWMRSVFGEGIARHFMRPYNLKVWATPPERMASHWIAERVSVVDYARVLRSIATGSDDLAWGPNNTFAFPAAGGTGEIYRRVAARMRDRIRFHREVVAVDPVRRLVHFGEGRPEHYDALVSTMPLDLLVESLTECPGVLREAAHALEHNGVYMVGIGYRHPLRDGRSWLYFPQGAVPFYRATNFAKYAPANVPHGDTARYCSYMTETSYSRWKPESPHGLEDRVEEGLRTSGVIAARPEVASMHREDVPYAYPIPTLPRDAALAVILPWLERQRCYSRGRFGTWRYEVGNMDHATKMGIDVARALVRDQDEELVAA